MTEYPNKNRYDWKRILFWIGMLFLVFLILTIPTSGQIYFIEHDQNGGTGTSQIHSWLDITIISTSSVTTDITNIEDTTYTKDIR